MGLIGETDKYAHMSTEGIKQTASTCSTASGSKIPLRYDFGPGLRSCSICEVSRCFNRGCEVTHRVICEECWPAYVRIFFTDLGVLASFLSRSAVLDSEEEEQLRESLTEEEYNQDKALPLNTTYKFKPSVGSWLLPKPLEVVHTRMVSDDVENASVIVIRNQRDATFDDTQSVMTATCDANDIAIEELSFESSLLGAPLSCVREISCEQERPTPNEQDADNEDKQAHRIKITFQPGPIGIRFQNDTVISVVAGSQADRVGIGIGWKIRRLQGFRCFCFGDKRLKASRKGMAPYDVTFEVCTEPSLPIAHTEAKNSIASSPPKVQELLPDCYDALDAKLQELQQEAASVLAEVEKKVNRVSARLAESEQRQFRDLTNREQYEQCLRNPCQQRERETSSELGAPPNWGGVVNIGIANDNPKMDRREPEGNETAHTASGYLGAAISELEMGVAATSELKRRASNALELVAIEEQETTERISGLEAAIHAKEQQLANNFAVAEHIIKQIEQQSNRRKDIKIELKEAVGRQSNRREDIKIESEETTGEPASFQGCVSSDWLSVPICHGSDGEVFKRISWFHRWLRSTSI